MGGLPDVAKQRGASSQLTGNLKQLRHKKYWSEGEPGGARAGLKRLCGDTDRKSLSAEILLQKESHSLLGFFVFRATEVSV